ncbi:tyrosine-type recombinase/integrase [Azospirillum tabaci]|uniref:tyrosine-type recombinase/integrase n=1 Tax=Azospirillum tabaci TaxID=2752310 RepID=UPI0016610E8C|nr:tyrosine-type recombinase/integrase [Azospirillum tabaci]
MPRTLDQRFDATWRVLRLLGDAVARPTTLKRFERAARMVAEALAPETARNVLIGIKDFTRFCVQRGSRVFPATPNTVLAYVRRRAGVLSTEVLSRRVAELSRLHRLAGCADPTEHPAVALALKGAARRQRRHRRQAAPLTLDIRDRIQARLGHGLVDLRDAALLDLSLDLLGRRSETVSIDVGDIERLSDGSALVRFCRAKVVTSDAETVGWISPATLATVDRWTAAAGITDGPLLRSLTRSGVTPNRLSPEHVSRAFKRLARLAGLDPVRISSHSPRVGMAQELTAGNFAPPLIMHAGGWRAPHLPARYAARLAAARGAVAQLHRQRVGSATLPPVVPTDAMLTAPVLEEAEK